MMDLFEYIKENQISSNQDDARKYIKKCLNYLEDNFWVEISKLVEKEMEKNGIYIDSFSNTIDNELKLRLGENDVFSKQIISILNKYKDFTNLSSYYQSGDLIDIKDLFKSNNILKYIEDHVGISKNTILELYNIEGGSGVAIGKGEILLTIVCKNAIKSEKGDVTIIDNNHSEVFEIKGNNGAFVYNWSGDLELLRKTFEEDNENLIGARRDNKVVLNRFADLLEEKTGIKIDKKNAKEVRQLWTAYALYIYKQSTNFDYFVLGNFITSNKWVCLKIGDIKSLYKEILKYNIIGAWPTLHIEDKKDERARRCRIEIK